jgi:hypothetical protein
MAVNSMRKPGQHKTADPDLNAVDSLAANADVDEKREDPLTGDAASKSGKQSSAQKAAASRYNLGPIPKTSPTAGASGKEEPEE